RSTAQSRLSSLRLQLGLAPTAPLKAVVAQPPRDVPQERDVVRSARLSDPRIYELSFGPPSGAERTAPPPRVASSRPPTPPARRGNTTPTQMVEPPPIQTPGSKAWTTFRETEGEDFGDERYMKEVGKHNKSEKQPRGDEELWYDR